MTSDPSASLPHPPDPRAMFRVALVPVLTGTLPAGSELAALTGPENFADWLFRQRLHALWLNLIETGNPIGYYAELARRLKDLTVPWAARELPQWPALRDLHAALAQAEIPYFVAKGAQLRQVYYERPLLRPAVDIDVFVRPLDRRKAVEALNKLGFTAHPLAETLSHELKLSHNQADIDLHWELFRPGRARPGLMDWLFGRREQFGEYWGLDATASLLVMLVHPAITKYLLSPTSMLIHQVDQALLIRCGKVDWRELQTALERYGMNTAAWSSLYVLRSLGGVEAPEGFEAGLRPGKPHAAYLRLWIDRAWINKWFERRWLVAGLFSLALQDSLADALRAAYLQRRSKGINSLGTVERLQQPPHDA